MTMIYDPIPFVNLSQKFLLETTSLLWVFAVHNPQMLFMLWIKYQFSECLAPLHKHEGHQWKTFWRLFFPGPQTRKAFGDSYTQIFLRLPNFVLIRKMCFKHNKNKNIYPLECILSPKL